MARMFVLYLLSLTIRSLVLAGLTSLILIPIRSVQFRHAVWTVMLCSLFLMPVADALLPSLVPAPVPKILLPIQTFIVVTAKIDPLKIGADVTPPVSRPIDGWLWAVVLIIFVALLLLMRLYQTVRQIRRIRKESLSISTPAWAELRASDKRLSRISLRESPAITVPLTLGFGEPLLILPIGWRQWDHWTLQAVLAHELTHVRRWDWAITALAAVTKCIFWFNPLVWWLERKLAALAEDASDEACVRLSGDAGRYAELLLQFAAAAKYGHRWIGGVAMAQYKISRRVERILKLQHPGSGILPRAGWALLFLLALPALYVSAGVQSRPVVTALATPVGITRIPEAVVPVSVPTAIASLRQATPQGQPAAPQGIPAPTARPQTPAPAETRETPPTTVPNPDLVGEIRLILAPIQTQGQKEGQVGLAIWNVRNGALTSNSWTANTTWAVRNAMFVFALTGVDGRNLLFENSAGTFSYGCPDCSFFVWESGVGLPSANAGPGIVFRLSPDGNSISATCRAKECQIAANSEQTLVTSVVVSTLRDSETRTFGVAQPAAANNSVRRCFSVFGNVKADGTPFTSADCPGGTAVLPPNVFFSVTR